VKERSKAGYLLAVLCLVVTEVGPYVAIVRRSEDLGGFLLAG
jgi:hypothetical protein